MSSTSTATLPLPAATPHLRAVRSVSSPAERWHGGPVPQRSATGSPSGPAQQGPAQAGFGQPVAARAAGAAIPSVSPVSPAAAPVVPPLPPQALLAALPEGAAVVAALPQGSLPQALLAQYGAQFGGPAGQPMVGYLVLVPAEGGGLAAVPGAGQPGFPVASVPAPSAGPAAVGVPAPGVPGQSVVGPSVVGPSVVGVSAVGASGAAARPVRPAGRGISVDTERRNAYVDGQLLDLTYLEFELLAHLTEHPQRVHTRDHLVSAVWGYGHVGDGRTVDVHVARLRRKLGVAYRESIVTVRRVGYKYTPVA